MCKNSAHKVRLLNRISSLLDPEKKELSNMVSKELSTVLLN